MSIDSNLSCTLYMFKKFNNLKFCEIYEVTKIGRPIIYFFPPLVVRSGIRDPGSVWKSGSGIWINIPDPQHCWKRKNMTWKTVNVSIKYFWTWASRENRCRLEEAHPLPSVMDPDPDPHGFGYSGSGSVLGADPDQHCVLIRIRIQEHEKWPKLTNKPSFLPSKRLMYLRRYVFISITYRYLDKNFNSTFCALKVWPGAVSGLR